MQLGVDIGGTFTDFVYTDPDGKIVSYKVPSVPSQPQAAIGNGLKLLPTRPDIFLHGTTVATNTVIERKGARCAFITTAGFKDLLHIGRQTRPSLYDFRITKKEPLVPRSLCFELDERIDATGSVVKPLIPQDLELLLTKLKRSKVSSIAVCLLFAYLNPKHERQVGRFLKKKLGIPIALSSDILPEFREYERASTTVMNAYLLEKVGTYLSSLSQITKSQGLSEYYVMQSSGGVVESKYIKSMPVRTLLSGPAAGVAASAFLGRQLGEPNLITFDMGGTSADVAAISDSEIVWTPHGEIDALPLKIPMVEIITIGAGGGSIAWKDHGGALRVGPESAGADPGPICYGKGGPNITVTDANLLLGIIDPGFFLGGEFPLVEEPVRKIGLRFARTLNYTLEEMAEGVRRVVEANMLRAVKRVSTEKGLEPKNFGLVAFGGAGPIHAAAIMQELDLSKVIVPVSPGTFSAYGLLVADVKLDYSQTYLCELESNGVGGKIEMILASHSRAAHTSLKAQKVNLKNAEFLPSADLRYSGQSFEVNVPLSKSIAETVDNFHREHKKLYGYSIDDADVELVNVRLSVRVDRGSKMKGKDRFMQKHLKRSKKPTPLKQRSIVIDGEKLRTPMYSRSSLDFGRVLSGPVVIADSGSTALILPDMIGEIDRFGNLIIENK